MDRWAVRICPTRILQRFATIAADTGFIDHQPAARPAVTPYLRTRC